MELTEIIKDIVDGYFSECVADGEIAEKDTYVREHLDGWSPSFSELHELVELAEEGLDNEGSYELNSKTGVRSGLAYLAWDAVCSRCHQAIDDAVKEHDLDLCDGISDSPPDGESDDYDGSHIDGLMVWRLPEWAVWKHVEELGLWADFTTICPPLGLDVMKQSIDDGDALE